MCGAYCLCFESDALNNVWSTEYDTRYDSKCTYTHAHTHMHHFELAIQCIGNNCVCMKCKTASNFWQTIDTVIKLNVLKALKIDFHLSIYRFRHTIIFGTSAYNVDSRTHFPNGMFKRQFKHDFRCQHDFKDERKNICTKQFRIVSKAAGTATTEFQMHNFHLSFLLSINRDCYTIYRGIISFKLTSAGCDIP